MNEKEMIRDLIGYIHSILDFIDVEDFENEENVEIVNGGYEEIVKPAVEYIYGKQEMNEMKPAFYQEKRRLRL